MGTSTMKEFFRLMRDVNKFTDGQAEVYLDGDDVIENKAENEDENENVDSNLTFYLVIKPNDGYYDGGRIKFKVELDDYPTGPPNVTCCNVIYHPNIDFTEDDNYGSVCVNLLGSDWTPEVGLDGCVMAVLFLFYNPQLDDALSPVFSGSGEHDDLETFAENVKISMCGGEVDGYTFENIMSNEWDKEKENGENKPDEDNCESSGVSAENDKVSTPEEDIHTKSVDKEVDNEAEKEPIKDETSTDTECCVPNPVDVEGTSNIVQYSDATSTSTEIENAIDRTSPEHQNDPLAPCDTLCNTITDNCSTDNENVASSSVQGKTDLVVNAQDVGTDHDKSDHRQTIVKYIKSKLNVFSGFLKLVNQCKGIIPKR